MKQSSRSTEQQKAPAESLKRPYRKPTLVVHGDVSRITGFLGRTGHGRGGTPIGGLYSNS